MSDAREALVAHLERVGMGYGLHGGLKREVLGAWADAILAEFDVTPRGHDHEWQRRQNVTSRGYRMTPYEVCVVDGCGAARQVDEPATFDHEPEWEYGVKWGDEPDHNPPAICGSREHAESRAAESHGDKIVRRTPARTIPAGEWEEVSDE